MLPNNMLRRQFFRIAFSLPRRVRWRLFRQFGGREKKWVQWIYDGDGEYSLRRMRELNCIFVHIPKAAGIAVTHALFGNKGAAHASVGDYLSVFGSKWFDQAFKFTFVRHPVRRVVSAYDFLRRGGLHDDDRRFANEHLRQYATIDEFVAHGLDRPNVRNWNHFRDQTGFLTDPRTGALNVDFIGRVETIEKDFEAICSRLGVSTALKRENARADANEDPTLKLSPASTEKIRQVYERDFALLGYD